MSGVFHVDEDAYDDFMGRYSMRLAPLFAEFARTLRLGFPHIEVHEAPAEQLPFRGRQLRPLYWRSSWSVSWPTRARPCGTSVGSRTASISMWGVEEVQMFGAIDRTPRTLGAGSAEQGGRRYCTPEELQDLFVKAGLANVETCELDVTAPYVDFDDFWRSWAGRLVPRARGCTAWTTTSACSPVRVAPPARQPETRL